MEREREWENKRNFRKVRRRRRWEKGIGEKEEYRVRAKEGRQEQGDGGGQTRDPESIPGNHAPATVDYSQSDPLGPPASQRARVWRHRRERTAESFADSFRRRPHVTSDNTKTIATTVMIMIQK